MKQKHIFIAALAFLLLAFSMGAGIYKYKMAQQAAQMASQNQAALQSSHSPTFGNADAPVQIVEFLDPACGTCKDFYPLVKQMMAAHPGKIRVSVRYAPFHPGSESVVRALEAARKQGQFRPALEALFGAQDSWVQNHTAQLDRIWAPLAALSLDMERLKTDMNSPEIAQLVAQDLADAKTMNVTMTPEFFVNGKPLPNFGFEELKALVDEALAASNAK